MRYPAGFLIVAILWGVFAVPSPAAAPQGERAYRQSARKFGFTIVTAPRLPAGIRGDLLPAAQLEPELDRFFAALELLSVGFVKKSGLDKVVIVADLTIHQEPAGGAARGNTIFLNRGFSAQTVAHEIFHVFDPVRRNDKWTRLNNRAFVYRGNAFYAVNYRPDKRRKLAASQKRADLDADFVSEYAQSFEWEDRAETFAAMVVEGRRFLARTEKSPVLKNKMEFIIRQTERSSLLGRDYWQKKFNP